MHRVLMTIVVLALAAAACGGDDDGEIASTVDDAVAAEETTADDESAGDGSTDDGQGDAAEPATGDPGSDWCDAVRSAEQGEASPLDFDILGLSPEELEARFTDNIAVLEEWEAKAPPEISDQVTTLVDAFRTVVSLAEDAEWDLLALGTDPAFLAAFDTAELEAAADDIDRYSADVCGVDLGVAATGATESTMPTIPEPADGDAVAQFLAAFGLPPSFLTDEQTACLNRELEGAFPGGVPDEITISNETIELFDRLGATCGIADR